MEDSTPADLLHDLVNGINALLLDLQLSAERHPRPPTAQQLHDWAGLAQTVADQAIELREHLDDRGGPGHDDAAGGPAAS